MSPACSCPAHQSVEPVKAFPLLGLLLCLAMFPRFTASALALTVLAGLAICLGALFLSALFAPSRPR